VCVCVCAYVLPALPRRTCGPAIGLRCPSARQPGVCELSRESQQLTLNEMRWWASECSLSTRPRPPPGRPQDTRATVASSIYFNDRLLTLVKISRTNVPKNWNESAYCELL